MRPAVGVVGFVSLLAMVTAPRAAGAQPTPTTGATPSITPTSQPDPVRTWDTGPAPTRHASLTPLGVSYQDCLHDLTMNFSVTVSGFDGRFSLQVWAGKGTTCTAAGDRGLGGVAPVCWLVNQGTTGLLQSTANTRQYAVRAQDVVGQEQTVVNMSYNRSGPEACTKQPSFLAVPININFLAIPSSGDAPTVYTYALNTDLVGPQPPVIGPIKDGDTLFIVQWTPNSDSDTAAYDIVMDPARGHEDDGATPSDASYVSKTVCDDTGAAASAEAGDDSAVASDDSGDGDVGDGAVATGADAAPNCHTETVANPVAMGGAGLSCDLSSTVLTGGTLATGSATEIIDSGDDAAAVTAVGGGIWNPPPANVIDANVTTGTTVSGLSASTYTITGLRNVVNYHVAVAAVDAYGNVGPPSTQSCDYPDLVTDFWDTYRASGGKAGGGFCALEAVGGPAGSTMAFGAAGAMAMAVLRRLRRKR